jgi:hypothetical protein
MREIRLSGSVRGAGREVRPYRDPPISHAKHGGLCDAGRDEDGRETKTQSFRVGQTWAACPTEI